MNLSTQPLGRNSSSTPRTVAPRLSSKHHEYHILNQYFAMLTVTDHHSMIKLTRMHFGDPCTTGVPLLVKFTNHSSTAHRLKNVRPRFKSMRQRMQPDLSAHGRKYRYTLPKSKQVCLQATAVLVWDWSTRLGRLETLLRKCVMKPRTLSVDLRARSNARSLSVTIKFTFLIILQLGAMMILNMT